MKRFFFLLSLCFIFIACERDYSHYWIFKLHNVTDKIVYMETITIDGEFLSQAILPDSTGYAMRHVLFPYQNSKTEITKLIPINILYDDQWFFVDGTDSLSWMYKDNYDYIGMVEEYGNVCVYELTEDFILSLRRLEK
mgnify:FL=1